MNLETLLSKVLSNPAISGAGGGLLAGGLMTALGNKQARHFLGGATKLGAAAAVGALAVEALRRYRARETDPGATKTMAAPRLALSSVASEQAQVIDPALERMVIAMLSAARADGELDAEETARIEERLATIEVDAGVRAHALAVLDQPADPYRVAKLAENENQAAELYLASLCAIKTDHWAETAYLKELQSALRLPQALVDELTASLQNEASSVAA